MLQVAGMAPVIDDSTRKAYGKLMEVATKVEALCTPVPCVLLNADIGGPFNYGLAT
jgi:hypothetical protein